MSLSKSSVEILSTMSSRPTLLKDIFMGLKKMPRGEALTLLHQLEHDGLVKNMGILEDKHDSNVFGTAYKLTAKGVESSRVKNGKRT